MFWHLLVLREQKHSKQCSISSFLTLKPWQTTEFLHLATDFGCDSEDPTKFSAMQE